jgi:hypothetical protein
LADALEAGGFRAALSVQRKDGASLSRRDQRAIERIVREAEGHGSTELSDHEISRVVAAYLDGKERTTKASSRTKRATPALRTKAARMGRGASR